MKHFFLVLLLLSFLVSYSFSLSSPTEEELKTAFVYNFLKFVSWPEINSQNIYLCFVGETKLEPYLLSLDGKKIRKKLVKVREIKKIDSNLSQCHAIFVGKVSKKVMKQILQEAEKNMILTISDVSGFVESGGIIEIFLFDNKIRFKINLFVANKSGLKISSRLLKLAQKVIRNDHS